MKKIMWKNIPSVKSIHTDLGKISIIKMVDQGPISKIHKEALQVKKNINNPQEMGR